MFQVNLSDFLQSHGIQASKNAVVVDGRIRVKQEMMIEEHKVVAHFILILVDNNKIREATCNIEAVHNSAEGWKEYTERVTKLLKEKCCNSLKGKALPVGKKGAEYQQD